MFCAVLFVCSVVWARGAPPETIVIGALYPLQEDGGFQQFAVQTALKNIAAQKEPGLAALYASKTRFRYVDRNSGGEQKLTLEATIDLVQKENVTMIVGPSYSSESLVASLLGTVFKVPVLSYASTLPLLSSKDNHPYFFRDVPSDAAQGRSLAELVSRVKQTKWYERFPGRRRSLYIVFPVLVVCGLL